MRSIAVLALVLLAACDRSPTAPANKLLVTAFATPDTLATGTSTIVIVAITNVSDQPQLYSDTFCGPAYHIFDSSGAQTDTTSYFCSDVLFPPKTLAPGKQATFASEWATTLPPGQYSIRATLAGDGIENIPYPVWIVPPTQTTQSARITSMGSVRPARHAGTPAAISAAATSTTHPPA